MNEMIYTTPAQGVAARLIVDAPLSRIEAVALVVRCVGSPGDIGHEHFNAVTEAVLERGRDLAPPTMAAEAEHWRDKLADLIALQAAASEDSGRALVDYQRHAMSIRWRDLRTFLATAGRMLGDAQPPPPTMTVPAHSPLARPFGGGMTIEADAGGQWTVRQNGKALSRHPTHGTALAWMRRLCNDD
jgi:hypothetical protein